MCGIVGYIGNKNTKDIILQGLYALDYRGYDSSGVSFIKDNKIITYKELGLVNNLEKTVKNVDFNNCAIAHTRWATHGSPSVKNAHPHNSGKWSLAHNGIIENANGLKDTLKDHKFYSETDTEVIVALLDQISTTVTNPMEAIIKTCSQLNGSYALVIINADTPNKIYVAREQSPLYIAKTSEGHIISSDLSLFENKSTEYYTLNNGDFAEIDMDNIIFFNKKQEKFVKKPKKLSLCNTMSDLKNYKHYMIKEINDIPLSLSNTHKHYQKYDLSPIKDILQKVTSVHFVGCGTAYHSALMGAKFIENICHIPAYTHIGSDFNDKILLTDKDSLYVIVSQSGETSDTIKAMHRIQKTNKVLAITNVLHSTIAQESDFLAPTYAGKEISVASTKAYNTQILTMYELANNIAKLQNKETHLPSINTIITEASNILKNNNIDELSYVVQKYNQIFFIGRSYDYVTAMEGSLKLKEISYINCSAFPAGELKHGTIALVDDNTLVIAIVTDPKVKTKMESALNEVKARGAKTLLITNLSIKEELTDYIYRLPCMNEYDAQIISCIPLQLLAYYVSIHKGFNPDKPKNLAKSVTVE